MEKKALFLGSFLFEVDGAAGWFRTTRVGEWGGEHAQVSRAS